MKPIKCMLGMHSYSQASTEVKVVDERSGHLICRVRNCCVYCGKTFEDIVPIPLPKWLSIDGVKMGGEENADKVELDYSQICWASAKCKYRTRDGNCKLDHCVR